MRFENLLRFAASMLSLSSAAAELQGTRSASISRSPVHPRQKLLQDLVTFDEHSVFIRGERLFIYSGEFHPFRLPVPGLWLDVFQKIKSLGFNGVSFYVAWTLVEGHQGEVNLDGIFDLRPFFDAAAEAGIYLIARPGPYINAEVAAGGFPGWALRIGCVLRSNCTEYEDATKTYSAAVGKMIADAQITNGGPVVIVQPENEYSNWPNVNASDFPTQMNREYMAFVEEQFRDAGIVVPFIVNDNLALGSFAPGTGEGAVDLYGIDSYPLRWDCSQPTVWQTYRWPTNWQLLHEHESPSTPFMIPEFQGGVNTGWGSVNMDMCNALVNMEAIRVVYKNNYSFGVKLMNIYMTYGGTNWGNLGYLGGSTSYDYGAAINEFREVWREKYSEEKLQANFFKVSPAYLTATPGNEGNGTYASTTGVGTTPLFGQNGTNFYIVRQADFTSTADVSYALQLPTSVGNLSIPQLGGQLTIFGRDSKLMVTDYDVGGTNLIYSTADLFTWAKNSEKTTLIFYGVAGEIHEFAVPAGCSAPTVSSSSVKTKLVNSTWVVQWTVTPEQQVVSFNKTNLEILLLWRNDAYNYWVLELEAAAPISNYSSPSKSSVIVKSGYLLRTAAIDGSTLHLTGDFNTTTNLELIYEPTGKVKQISTNGVSVPTTLSPRGTLTGTVKYSPPTITVPDLTTLEWKTLDSLPELHQTYDDSQWPECDHSNTTNDQLALLTPTSLYASDYGFHTGSLLYRGHFTATGSETSFTLTTSSGWAFGHSVWLNSTFLGSWTGSPSNKTYTQTLPIASNLVTAGHPAVLTVLIDHMGQDEEAPGTDAPKYPMGILNFTLAGREQAAVTWKMTGNFGGESYVDKTRGPRNEGATFAERHGYHLPAPPSAAWATASPVQTGLTDAGVALYTTSFDLDVPAGWDVPMAFVFANDTAAVASNYRVQLFVNGYQFGKFIPMIGPYFEFPVPEGILNYAGKNYVAVTLWAQDAAGAKMAELTLQPRRPILSAMQKPGLSPQPAWTPRTGAY